jgi:hypothetical protein
MRESGLVACVRVIAEEGPKSRFILPKVFDQPLQAQRSRAQGGGGRRRRRAALSTLRVAGSHAVRRVGWHGRGGGFGSRCSERRQLVFYGRLLRLQLADARFTGVDGARCFCWGCAGSGYGECRAVPWRSMLVFDMLCRIPAAGCVGCLRLEALLRVELWGPPAIPCCGRRAQETSKMCMRSVLRPITESTPHRSHHDKANSQLLANVVAAAARGEGRRGTGRRAHAHRAEIGWETEGESKR